MDEELLLKPIFSGGPVSPWYRGQARQSSYREVHLLVTVPSQLHLQWVVGEEQTPEQLSPSLRFLFIFPMKGIRRVLMVLFWWKSSAHCKHHVGFLWQR